MANSVVVTGIVFGLGLAIVILFTTLAYLSVNARRRFSGTYLVTGKDDLKLPETYRRVYPQGVLLLSPKRLRQILALFEVACRGCERVGLEYCIWGGTLLGHVRHEGMIPHDDDLDLMLLPDQFLYFKLEELREFVIRESEHYDLVKVLGWWKVIDRRIPAQHRWAIAIDLFPSEEKPNGDIGFSGFGGIRFPQSSVPPTLLLPLQRINFHRGRNIPSFAPREPEKVLEYLFGRHWNDRVYFNKPHGGLAPMSVALHPDLLVRGTMRTDSSLIWLKVDPEYAKK